MKGAFISYSRKDSAFVIKLVQDLRRLETDVWLDQLDIKISDRWDQAIEKELKDCKKFIVILSANSISSQNVLDEVNFALHKGKEIIPVLFENCEVPFRLQRFQHLDLRQNYESGLKELNELLVSANNLQGKNTTEYGLVAPSFPEKSRKEEKPTAEKNIFLTWLNGSRSSKYIFATVLLVMLISLSFFLIKAQDKKDLKKLCDGLEKSKRIECYLSEAENGDTSAMFELGNIFYESQTLDTLALAKNWLQKAAKAGHSGAMVSLAILYEEVEEDSTNVSYWMSKAAESGNALAMNFVGNQLYNSGEYEKAMQLYSKSAGKQWPAAMYNLGHCYFYGKGTAVDSTQALDWMLKAAKMDNIAAMLELTKFYSKGLIVAKDSIISFNWLLKAAQKGDDGSMFQVALEFFLGENKEKAFFWFKKAAEEGLTRSMSWLGSCYEYGWGTEKDYKSAFYWYEKSASLRDEDAMYQMGRIYEKGNVVQEDAKESFKWYLESAKLGHPEAMYETAGCYESGIGIEKNSYEAFQWCLKAVNAKQNYADAIYRLGCYYYYGTGITKNLVKAEELIKEAADLGNENAIKYVKQ